jgi:hypothetical protein
VGPKRQQGEHPTVPPKKSKTTSPARQRPSKKVLNHIKNNQPHPNKLKPNKRKKYAYQYSKIKFNNINNNSTTKDIPIRDDKFPTIFNLAKTQLTKAEKEVLSLGLKFCPTPIKCNASIYELAIADLNRKLLLQAYRTNKDPLDPKSSRHLGG